MKRKNIYLTDKQTELLNKEIRDSGLKLAELVRRIFDEHFEKKEKRNIELKNDNLIDYYCHEFKYPELKDGTNG